MRFRPCIDIHNGIVKQIVGGSLSDAGDRAEVNYSSEFGADYYAGMYRKDGLKGGHVILLNPGTSKFYDETCRQGIEALHVYPGGLQIGGGITDGNAKRFIEEGASHVIVTSFVFRDGEIVWDNLKGLADSVGKNRVVLDLSCRRRDGFFYIVTDRWQKFTAVPLNTELLGKLGEYCDEFLVHGVDVEGTGTGMDEVLVRMLAEYGERPVTYAGGIGSLKDVEDFRRISGGAVDFTIGSALDIFGGKVPYDAVKNL